MKKISYREAINEALTLEMSRDPSVFVYGIDVADHKNIYGTTKGLIEKFGNLRCFSTPLSEETLVGFGLGAAINGLRPVNVHMRVDFLILAMNQIVNMISSFQYGSAGKLKVPLVIRAIIGKGWGQSYQHSKSLHSFFAHVPGLKVVMPTTPNDARGLLISSIRDNNPVIFLEHRFLYDAVDEVSEKAEPIPIGKSKVLRRGRDLTIVSTSWMNVEAMEASMILAKRGVSVEVIDPRTISPLDIEPIVKSVFKTGHLIVADYDWINCGFGSEITAQISEKCFGKLKTPITRLGFAPTPCPCTRPLEDAYYPNAIDIIRNVEKMLGLSPTDLSTETFYTYENKFKGPF